MRSVRRTGNSSWTARTPSCGTGCGSGRRAGGSMSPTSCPDDFIADIRAAMEQEKPDSILLGEVWEDGSNKIAYSRRRRYLLGSETHGLMNYPFRTAALGWLTGGDAADFRETMETIARTIRPRRSTGR